MPTPRRQSSTNSTVSTPVTSIIAPKTLGTTCDRKSDTLVTSPSTRWISSPGVWRRWNSWSSPSTWRVMSRRSSLVIPQASLVARRTTMTPITCVTTAIARNSRPRRAISPAVVPSVAASTTSRTTSGPAIAPAVDAAMSAPSSAHRRASGRSNAHRARQREGDRSGTDPFSRSGTPPATWVSHPSTRRGAARGTRNGRRYSWSATSAAPTMPASLVSVAGTISTPTSISGTHLSALRLAPPPTMISSGEMRKITLRR